MTKTSEYSTLKIQSNFTISIDISSSKGNTVLKSQMDWDRRLFQVVRRMKGAYEDFQKKEKLAIKVF